MTSNIGASLIHERFEGIGEESFAKVHAATKVEIFEMLKKSIRPEFLNRIDEVIMFTPLGRADIRDIVVLHMEMLKKQLLGMGIEMSYTNEAVNRVSEMGFDPQFGARPLKRALQKEVLNELSKQLLSGKVRRESEIVIDAFENKIVFYNPQEAVSNN
jgi:ATP-dependent Clp protease ATP-binding subunit ClpB